MQVARAYNWRHLTSERNFSLIINQISGWVTYDTLIRAFREHRQMLWKQVVYREQNQITLALAK